jgi:hypothetical protein
VEGPQAALRQHPLVIQGQRVCSKLYRELYPRLNHGIKSWQRRPALRSNASRQTDGWGQTVPEKGWVNADALRFLKQLRYFGVGRLRPGEIEPVQVHDFGPGRYKVVQEIS